MFARQSMSSSTPHVPMPDSRTVSAMEMLNLYRHASIATRALQIKCDEAEHFCPEMTVTFDALADEFHRVNTELQRLERQLERAIDAMGV